MEDQLLAQTEASEEPDQEEHAPSSGNIRETDLSGDGELQGQVESCLVVRG